MLLDYDQRAKVAIRLGRAYTHKWASTMDKTTWSWSSMVEAVRAHVGDNPLKRAPKIDDESVRWTHQQTQWKVDADGAEVVFHRGFVEAAVLTAYSDDLGPAIMLRLPKVSTLDQSDDWWRIDRAFTAVCTQLWSWCYQMPAPEIACDLLRKKLDSDDLVLLYRPGSMQALNADLSIAPKCNAFLQEAIGKSFLTEWHKIKRVPVAH
jgi:hypothetical protein